MELSVIICSHNPREDYLRRVLDALKAQILPKEQWELLLIDNASKEPIAKSWDLTWHQHARHIREDELGLTPARLRGIKESTGELLVFVDDDNVLSGDYLETILEVRRKMPFVEVIGSGNIAGEFETPPQTWMKPYLPILALREVERDLWSNNPMQMGSYPCGAGLCVSRNVATAYSEMLRRDSRRKYFDRRGSELTSGGDDDICFTAGHLGLGVGVFKSLSITHLISKEKLSESYLLRLVEGMNFSAYVLACLWKRPVRPPVHSLRWRFGFWRQRRKMTAIEQRFADAKVRAEQRAWKTIRALDRF